MRVASIHAFMHIRYRNIRKISDIRYSRCVPSVIPGKQRIHSAINAVASLSCSSAPPRAAPPHAWQRNGTMQPHTRMIPRQSNMDSVQIAVYVALEKRDGVLVALLTGSWRHAYQHTQRKALQEQQPHKYVTRNHSTQNAREYFGKDALA